jgi:ribosomal protein S6--L-glutamate ligase
MNIGMLLLEKGEHSQKRLFTEIRKKDTLHKMYVPHMYLSVKDRLGFDYKAKKIDLDIVHPYFADSFSEFGMTVLKHLEQMGLPCVNRHDTIVACKDKYLTNLALRKKKVPQPNAAIAFSAKDMMKHMIRFDEPVVVKLVNRSLGSGVNKVSTFQEAEDIISTFDALSQPIYLQEYIEHGGHDYRVLVIGGQVVASEKRVARGNEWKTNISLGGRAVKYNPPKDIREIAIKSAEAVKGDIIGVDMIINESPKVIELNCFAGFKGLEKATKKNIAGMILKHLKKKARR